MFSFCLFVWSVCTQSPYHFIFPDFYKQDLMTLYVFCSDQKKEKEKNLGFLIRILMWSSSCLLVFCFFFFFFFFEPDLWKLVKRREKQRCTGQLDHSLVSCSTLWYRIIFHYTTKLLLLLFLFSFHFLKFDLMISSCKLETAPLLSKGFTEPVQWIWTVVLWSMNLHYKFLV